MLQRQAIDGPQAQPPGYGLIAALQTLVRDDVTLAVGARWAPEQCGDGGRDRIEWCVGDTPERNPAPNPELAEADPFVVWAAYRCGAIGFESIDYVGRAERQLAAVQSFEVANELWTGALSEADGSPTPFLADISTSVVGAAALAPADALGCLEQAVAVALKGRRALIHCTPGLLVAWKHAQLIDLQGGQYLSPLRNIVVADAGYDGSGPGHAAAGATQWAYATDLIGVRLGTVQTRPSALDSAEEWVMAMRTTDNTVTVWSQRPALYLWDECAHLGVEVDLPVCVVSGS